jgi:thiol-disulfide isomerase/thioredoxin
MRIRRLGPWTARTARAIGLALLFATGCSQREELVPDPGVSPFYDGPAAGAQPKAAVPGQPPAAASPGSGSAPVGLAGVDTTDLSARVPDGPIRPDDVERQLRLAQRAASKGDRARATAILDRILEVKPNHREALVGRAALAMELSQTATSPEERAAAAEKAGTLARKLRTIYERLNRQELDLIARVLYDEIREATRQGHLDRAAAIVKEVHDAGFEPFDRVDHDEELAKLRTSPAYRAVMAQVDAETLAAARSRAKDRLAKPLGFAFDFHLTDLDGKPISLDQYRGKVVLVDIWGTWCKPCRDALPALVQMYYKHRRRGFDIIGLAYEPSAPDPQTALQAVKQFVKESGIPYRCAMGDEATQKTIPNFSAFPTTLLIDRAGKVRVLVTENTENALKAMDDNVQVLLGEPAPTPGPTPAASASPKPTAAAPKPAEPKPAAKAPDATPAGAKGPAQPR